MGDKIRVNWREVIVEKTSAGLLFMMLAVLLASVGCKEGQVSYPGRQMPETIRENTADLNAGHTLFHDKCAYCHGKPSEGRSERTAFFEPPAPDFTDLKYRAIDPAYLYWRIEVGKTVEPYLSQGSVMPAWGAHLSEKKIWQVVAYLQSRAH